MMQRMHRRERIRSEFEGKLAIKCASQVALVAKNMPAKDRDVRDMGSISGLGRSPG